MAKQRSSSDEMIPLPVAAFMLGYPYRGAYELMMRRCLRGELRGKRWWVSLADVRKLLETGEYAPAPVQREDAERHTAGLVPAH